MFNMKRFVLLFVAAAFWGIGCDSRSRATKEKLSAREFAKILEKEGSAQLLDVRSAEEFAGGHLEHAVNVDWNGGGFRQYASTLDKLEPVYVYCLSGGRSASAAAFLREQGFGKVYEMPGGMMEWRAEKLPEAGPVKPAGGLTLQQYENLLDSDKLVLVDFYADWCGPCKKMEPYLKTMEKELADKMILVRIDADQNPELCQQLNVTALPTLKLYKNKKLSWNHVGFVDESRVREKMSL